MDNFRIKFNLSKMETFELRYVSFETLYLKIKTEGFDDFKLKAMETMPDSEKFDCSNMQSGVILSKMKSKILKDVDLYNRINNDNYYLKSGGEVYEVLHSYFLEVEKTIYKSIKKEYDTLKNSKNIK